ncbi:hypothetical protein [Gardnerella vaginalis]|uniref:collagen-like triple helix repeat-containing protein n=1 Tax=Gardnerella vaginalis TaxID=2702 RepID=UPI0039EFFE96
MMNKKAIAAFAAGATLLAGFAMATPAFAKDDVDQTPTLEQTVNAIKAQLTQNETDVTAKENELTKKSAAQKGLDDEVAAKKAAFKKYSTYFEENGTPKAGATSVATADLAYYNAYVGAVDAAKANKERVAALPGEIQALKAEHYTLTEKLKKAQGNLDVYNDAHHSAAYHVGHVTKLKKVVDNKLGDKNRTRKIYDAKFADLVKAKAAMELAKARFDAAEARWNAAQVDGLIDSDPAVYKAAQDEYNRASAKYQGALKHFNDADSEFQKAKLEAEKASAAYNAAVKAYMEAWNAAEADGVSLPADLPRITDPLEPETLPGVPGVPTPGQPGQPGKPGQPGQPGKPGKPEVEKKKNDGKKLPGTGVGVTLTALAATMLAGMGAAVRKARH